MQGTIPDNILEEIRLKVDIIELVSSFIPLKGAGRSYKALCPFHPEKTPSFVVNPEKQIFHCFGCGAGGDVFSFLMRYENVTFPESVEILAEKAGVVLPKRGVSSGVENQKKMLFEVMEKASQVFEKILLTSSAGQEGRDYLKSRGLDRKIAEVFRLGFCPMEEEIVLKEFRRLNLPEELLEKTGLLGEKEQGRYLRFRARLIFPIFDVQGRVVGFGGRALGDRLPKYLNSPDTVLFNKSHLLYGLHGAKKSILEKGQVILVEGYIDVISVFRAGVENVVASLGTAFNENHVRLLRRFSQEAVVAYDGDEAGLEASLRALEIFLDQDVIVKIVKVPDGHDPDSFIRAKGKEAFENLIRTAPSMIDFKINILSQRYNGETESGKLTIAHEVLKTVGRLKSAILQDHYLQALSGKLKISEQALREELKTKVKARFSPASQSASSLSEKHLSNILEEDLLRILLHHNELIPEIESKIGVSDFQVDEYNLLFKSLLENKKVVLIDEPPLLGALQAKLLIESPSFKDPKAALQKCITAFKLRRYKRDFDRLNEKIKEIEKSGKDQAQIAVILSELQKLQKEIAFIKKV